MPSQPRTTTSSSAVTDQTFLNGTWTGRKSGNIFKAIKVTIDDGVKLVTYTNKFAKTYTCTADQFMSRFRPSTADELWDSLKSTAEMVDPESSETTDVVSVITPDHRHDLERLILYPDCRKDIEVGINRVVRRAEMDEIWGLSKIEPGTGRSILNFHGPPGTGKTLAAVAVAKKLDKKLLMVDYASIISKYVGDTAKHIKEAFKEAKNAEAVLMFDEADALLSRRIGMGGDGDSSATSINQNRNVLLTELDRFQGVVVMCTNFFQNFDEAFIRRIARHVEFKLPNTEMRRQLFKLHLPVMDRVEISEADWDMLANDSTEFSGGDILNAVVNGITRASMDPSSENWKLTHEDLEAEIESIKNAKKSHSRQN